MREKPREGEESPQQQYDQLSNAVSEDASPSPESDGVIRKLRESKIAGTVRALMLMLTVAGATVAGAAETKSAEKPKPRPAATAPQPALAQMTPEQLFNAIKDGSLERRRKQAADVNAKRETEFQAGVAAFEKEMTDFEKEMVDRDAAAQRNGEQPRKPLSEEDRARIKAEADAMANRILANAIGRVTGTTSTGPDLDKDRADADAQLEATERQQAANEASEEEVLRAMEGKRQPKESDPPPPH